MKKPTTSFNEFADLWDAKTGNAGVTSNQNNQKAIINLLGKTKNKTIYEIATGNGFMARKIAATGANVFASDVSENMITIAQTQYHAQNIIYSVREGTDFRGIPKLDAVLINQGIFYIKDISELCNQVKKHLKPGGYFVFTVTHSLFPVFRMTTGETTSMGEQLDLQKISELYLKPQTVTVQKKWKVNGKPHIVNYLTYKRPLSYYVNLCGDNGLYIDKIIETKSQTKKMGKRITSPIPGSYVIRAIKIK